MIGELWKPLSQVTGYRVGWPQVVPFITGLCSHKYRCIGRPLHFSGAVIVTSSRA